MAPRTDPLASLGVLGDPTRRAIVRLLRRGARPAGDIAEAFDLSWPTMSYHLRTLVDAGLLEARRNGNRVYYGLRRANLERAGFELLGLARDGRSDD
ncbi:MAG: metalloregulator ArsR/SmtB family transcription factor [Myxococcota bacterium]|nr:metalloregulator ArsR/SmtB family transcription factor [Myxococcota bacterium]MDW8362171.1 metalloregulator ArsR/SmtB family transcription factor [Myxococcales bacterium]